jgi:hypothetical protein
MYLEGQLQRPGRQIRFKSESVMAGLYLGIAVTGVNARAALIRPQRNGLSAGVRAEAVGGCVVLDAPSTMDQAQWSDASTVPVNPGRGLLD